MFIGTAKYLFTNFKLQCRSISSAFNTNIVHNEIERERDDNDDGTSYNGQHAHTHIYRMPDDICYHDDTSFVL